VGELFEAFSQEDSGYSRSYEGLGIGLRLTKRYLDVNERHASTSKAKRGRVQRLSVSFPSRAASHIRTRGGSIRARARGNPGLRRTLLVVEDDHETQKFLQLILASILRSAFRRFGRGCMGHPARHTVDLVLMDISLQGR
jgi:hypothetical protein